MNELCGATHKEFLSVEGGRVALTNGGDSCGVTVNKSRTWRRVPIIDLCEVHVDCVNRTAPVVSEQTPFKMIRTSNVRNGFIDVENVRYVTEPVYKKWTRRLVPKRGDVILTREAPLGGVGKIRTDDLIFLGQRLYHFRADPTKLDPDFLLYALMADDLQGQIRGFGSGATVEHMRLADIPELQIYAPEVSEQRRIGAILSAYDDLIENCQRRIRILESMARTLYREWFVNFRFPGHENVPLVSSPFGDIPEGWEVKKLKDLCHLTMGQSPKSEFYNKTGEGLPFHQGISDFGERFPTDRLFCSIQGRIAEEGDILFSVRAPVGRMNIADKKIVIGRGLSSIRHKSGFQAFLWEQLRNRFTKDDMIGNGAIFAAVTKDEMQGIDLICPPASLIIVASKYFEPIHSELVALSKQNLNLLQTRDLLLSRLVTGKMEIT
ncbi:MAG: restriction endonuclease subunit S [Chlorobiaceae bacterium]|nr:restriction endonuclease subunit S [Chlorobiaceae bacterium]